ncbi:MAG: ABC transporter permease [Candidatus Dojkabacteria bacterium]|nr:ABC transporter permease [Candidatus Dojkabacteria bacterium]
MKIIDIIKLSQQNMLRAPLRSFLTILALSIGTLTLTLTNALSDGIQTYVNAQVNSINSQNTIRITPITVTNNPLEVKKYDPENKVNRTRSQTLDEDIEKIQNIKNIKKVYKLYNLFPEYIYKNTNEKYEIQLVGSIIDEVQIPLAAGKTPSADEKDKILLSYNYLSPLGFTNASEAVGKKIKIGYKKQDNNIFEKEYEISGVLINSLTGGITRLSYQEITELSEELYGDNKRNFELIGILEKNDEESMKNTKEELKKLGFNGVTWDEAVNEIRNVLNILKLILNAFALIVIIAGSIGIINTILMGVYERTREIGLLKTLGMTSFEIFLLFAIEAILLGLWGGILGIFMGILIGNGLNSLFVNTFKTTLEGFQVFVFDIQLLLLINAFMMIIGFLAGTLPAIKASKLNPIDALRYE